jgi:plastocyanin
MTSRRSSVIGLVALMLVALAIPSAVAIEGPNVQATVSFGQWKTDPPFDRFTVPNVIAQNNHQLIPQEVKIKAGGAVNFIISGFHEPVIYDAGTQPGDINTALQLPIPPVPVPLINDPSNRIFRGVDPRTVSQDHVESVTFDKPGTYLVICAVFPHFVTDGMFGFVKVTGFDK